jgi:abortive infection bacteriophage resistance protein
VRYQKPALTPEQQADLLLSRGLIGERDEIASRLRAVSYYRLSAYWHPFRTRDSEALVPGTTFTQVWNLYRFDRQLRLLVMDPIERIEVFVRTQLALLHSAKYGPMGYANAANLPQLRSGQHTAFIEKIEEEQARASRTAMEFVCHFEQKYTSEKYLPVWMAIELMSFGGTLTFFRGVERSLQNEIARPLGFNAQVLQSWLVSLGTFRNICAHHQRLWNRVVGYRPLIPSHQPRWRGWKNAIKSQNSAHPQYLDDNTGRVGTLLIMLRHWMSVLSPDSDWHTNVRALFDEYPATMLEGIGLPAAWQTSVAWTY